MSKLKEIFFLLFLSMTIVVNMSSCDEDDKAPITMPTYLFPAEGAVVADMSVRLNASGSVVSNGNSARYKYYLGSSLDNMISTEAQCTLKPYTQYFWYAEVSCADETIQPIQTEVQRSTACQTILHWRQTMVMENGRRLSNGKE